MTRLVWLADVLRAAGLAVHEMDGWQTRGIDRYDPIGVVLHHTATGPNVADKVVDKLLVIGRPDLAGPLAQCGLRRDGTWVIVAAGRANHNGYGQWGNDSIGIEAYNDGLGEPWPKAQMKAYQVGVAAICRHMGWGITEILGHRETDPRRKIDPTFDLDEFRSAVAGLLTPTTEDDMLLLIKAAGTDPVYLFDGRWRWPVDSQAKMDVLTSPYLPDLVRKPDGWQPGKAPWHEWAREHVEAFDIAPSGLNVDVLAAAIAARLPAEVDVDPATIAAEVIDQIAGKLGA